MPKVQKVAKKDTIGDLEEKLRRVLAELAGLLDLVDELEDRIQFLEDRVLDDKEVGFRSSFDWDD